MNVKEDKDGLDVPTPKDDDPDGNKALAAANPMEQAWKLLKPLVSEKQSHLDVWLIVYDVSARRRKPSF